MAEAGVEVDGFVAPVFAKGQVGVQLIVSDAVVVVVDPALVVVGLDINRAAEGIGGVGRAILPV